MPGEFDLSIPFERNTLDNGLKVVLSRDPALPLVAINLWYHVGSKNEQPGRTGFAHLFEHMLFQGSEHVGTNDHFARVQEVGGVANGSTSRDRTNYYETLPSPHLALGLWLESDRMGFLLPAMTEDKLENQRQVVMNERLQRVDNQPYGRASERVHELLYPEDHPYHWPVIGYMEDIASAGLDQVQDFFATYYRPNNAVLTLVGDFDPRDALTQVERYFGTIEPGPQPPPPEGTLPQPSGERREVLRDDVRLPRVYLAYHAPAYGESAWYSADLLSTALALGKSSPLYQDLVYDRQLAQSVSAWVYDNELTGTFLVAATARPGVEARVLEEALTGHLEAAARPLAPEHLERAKNRTASHFYDLLQRIDQRADLLSMATTYFDDPGAINAELERYMSLEAGDLAAWAAEGLAPEGRVVVTVLSREEG